MLTSKDQNEVKEAIEKLNDWRSLHLVPLDILQQKITDFLSANNVCPFLISRRLKRLTSIQYKLDMNPDMGLGGSVSTLHIILPVGISFYTFTALSYSIDVYQGKVEPTKDVLAYLAYVMFFPSILSGPISRAQRQLPQYFKLRVFDYDKAVSACKLILRGGNKALLSRQIRHLRGCCL